MKKYIIMGLSVILIMMLVIPGSNVFALFADSETSSGNRADAWSSSFHEGTTKKQFEAGEEFYVDTATYPGNVVLHQTKYLFAAQGGGSSNAVYRYNESTQVWEGIAPVPNGSPTTYVGAGSGIAYPGSGNYLYCLKGNGTPYIYATQGNNTTGFYRYNIGSNAWSTMSVAPGAITTGGSMRWDGGGFIYVLQGASTVFWEYDLITDSWGQTVAPVTYPVSTGGAYASGSSQYDYAFTGGATNYFLAYDKAANTWSSKTSPGATGAGACLVYVGTGTGYAYAFQGGNSKVFWRYDVNANSWSTMTPASVAVTDGAGLVWTGGDYIYATFGNTKTFARYSILGN